MQRMERMKVMISKQRARAASREARKRRLRAKLRSNFRSSLGSLALAHPQALPTQPRVGAFGAKAARFMRSLSEHSLRPIDSAKGFCLWACDRAAPRAALLSFVGIKSSREPKPSMVRFRRIVLRVQTMGLLSKGFFKWLSTVRVYSLNTLRVKVEVGPSSLLVACRAGSAACLPTDPSPAAPLWIRSTRSGARSGNAALLVSHCEGGAARASGAEHRGQARGRGSGCSRLAHRQFGARLRDRAVAGARR